MAEWRNARAVMKKADGKTDEIAARTAEQAADVVIVRSGGPVAELICPGSRLQIVVKNGVGLEAFNVVAANQHRIAVIAARSLPQISRRIRNGH